MRHRMNVYFPPELLKQIADLADHKKLSRSAIVEAAVASFLSPDGADRREAAFVRRLDRRSRQVQRLERNVGITIETLALFIRFWLTITPPLPTDAQAAAQLKGRQRYEGFVEALRRRLQRGQSFLHEIPEDIDSHGPPAAPAILKPVPKPGIEDAGRRRAECAVLGERARAEITPAQRSEPARRLAERNAGRRDHGWCVGNEIARRIADLGLRKSGERGKQRRLILVKTDKSCMRHRKVGVDIDPRGRPIAVGPFDPVTGDSRWCRR
jgi:hypothetical protein